MMAEATAARIQVIVYPLFPKHCVNYKTGHRESQEKRAGKGFFS
jgi:hypothetical protein